MTDVLPPPQIQNIHFPRQVRLIKRLRFVSFIINDITICLSILSIVFWLFRSEGIHLGFLPDLTIFPISSVLFIISGIPLLFGAKRHLLDSHLDTEKEDRSLIAYGIPILFAVLVTVFGLINFLNITTNGVLETFHTAPIEGLCFLLIGLALIPPFTQFPHRFHLTQFLIFIVSGINVYVILENLYQVVSRSSPQHLVAIPLLTAIYFVLFCSGMVLRWSNRGFMGNFTLESTASVFALRVFLINLFAAPFIAFTVLLIMQHTTANPYQIMTLIVVCFAFISSLLLWSNVKILYGHELEHLLMRESLRFHNIDLTMEQEKLQKKMDQIEQEKKQYVEKLNSQTAWQDAVERLE